MVWKCLVCLSWSMESRPRTNISICWMINKHTTSVIKCAFIVQCQITDKELFHIITCIQHYDHLSEMKWRPGEWWPGCWMWWVQIRTQRTRLGALWSITEQACWYHWSLIEELTSPLLLIWMSLPAASSNSVLTSFQWDDLLVWVRISSNKLCSL